MVLKIDTKFEGKLTCASKNDLRNFANFHQSTFESLKNRLFSWVLLSKVEHVWVWNLQRSYVSWEWRMMQNLKRNWLANSKFTWLIWWILSHALENLKNLNFDELLLTKACNVWAKISTDELLLIALQIDDKFEEKLTCTF